MLEFSLPKFSLPKFSPHFTEAVNINHLLQGTTNNWIARRMKLILVSSSSVSVLSFTGLSCRRERGKGCIHALLGHVNSSRETPEISVCYFHDHQVYLKITNPDSSDSVKILTRKWWHLLSCWLLLFDYRARTTLISTFQHSFQGLVKPLGRNRCLIGSNRST